jgi:GNAT superfamily N-acetyltransferase
MLRIVKGEEKHILDIRHLWTEFLKYSEEFHPMFAVGEGAAEHMEKHFLRPALQDKNHLVLLALDDSKAVGYAIAKINEKLPRKYDFMTGVVDHLFVTQDCRRRGIGGQMYSEILIWFKDAGINRVEVQVIAKNKAACAFWKKQGYGDFEYVWEREI